MNGDFNAYFVDGGTTNTRVWLKAGERLFGPERLAVGVRETAVEGSTHRLKRELAAAFARLDQRAVIASPGARLAVAAGMITSPLGLAEVPHCQAPARAADLAAAAIGAEFPEFPGIRWLLLPGVRSGPREYDAVTAAEVDVVRGEETELMGALALGRVQPPLVFIHAGSHAKAIRVDADGSIVGGITTLGGELLDAVRRHTILAEAVSGAGRTELSLELLRAGAEHARRSGLSRALFLVRVLHLSRRYTPEQIDGFLLGAVVETDLAAIAGPYAGTGEKRRWVVSAPDALLPAWKLLMAERGIHPVVLGSADREACFLAGAEAIARLRGAR